jgi:hypothetical protein
MEFTAWLAIEMYDYALDFAVSPFLYRWVWTFRARLFSSLNACIIIARVSIAVLQRFLQNLMLFLRQIHLEIISDQIPFSK